MKEALNYLKSQVSSIQPPKKISDEEFNAFTKNCVVALLSGGESSRFKEVQGSSNANKNAFQLPNGDTMIEMTIRMYIECGFKDFVILAYHEAKSLEDILEDESKYGVNIKFSYDPGPVGKGGAIKNALENKSIPLGKHFIIHNPDDLILNYKGSFPKDIVSGHLEGISKGNIATVVVVEETPYTYTGMQINDNNVTQIETYPMIPIPTHIGVTLFSLDIRSYFDRYFNYSKKTDFESVLFPILSKEHKLYATSIPTDNWLAVNNYKSYKKLLEYLNLVK